MNKARPLPMCVVKRPGALYLPEHMLSCRSILNHHTYSSDSDYVIGGWAEEFIESTVQIRALNRFYYVIGGKSYYYSGKVLFECLGNPTYASTDDDGYLIRGPKDKKKYLFKYVPDIEWRFG